MKELKDKHIKYDVADEKGDVTVEVEVAPDRWEEAYAVSFEKLKQKVKVDGFRPGKAPKKVVEQKISGELVDETLNRMLPTVAYEVVAAEDFQPITKLDYELTDFASDKTLKFKFLFSNYPQVKLGDFSKLEMPDIEVDVSEQEIDETLYNMFEARYDKAMAAKDDKGDKQGTDDEKPDKKQKMKGLMKWLGDAQVKELGIPQVESVDQLREQIESSIANQQRRQQEEVAIDELIKQAVELCDLHVSSNLIEKEKQRLEADYKSRIEELGLEVDDFLASQGKKLEDLESEWEQQAMDRFQRELLLTEITRAHKLTPSPEDIQSEIDAISDQKMKKEYDNDNGRRYVASVLIQQRGLDKLIQLVKGDKEKSSDSKKKQSKGSKKK